MATVSCSTQKVTTPSVNENLLQTTLMPSTTTRDTNEDQVPSDTFTGCITPKKLEYDIESREVAVVMSQGQRMNNSFHQCSFGHGFFSVIHQSDIILYCFI